MDLLFHQNMRNYGGAAVVKNATAEGQLKTIGGRCGGKIICAGFTELKNSSAAMSAQIGVLGQCLNPEIDTRFVLPVGISGAGYSEFIGLAWDNTKFAVSVMGYFTLEGHNRKVTCYPTRAAVGWAIPYPTGKVLADFRSPVFMYGTYGGAATIVCFMHNMYEKGDKTMNFDQITKMLATAAAYVATLGLAAPAQYYVGGDFNLDIRAPSKSGLTPIAALLADGKTREHTTNANCYDYWLVSDATLSAKNATVWGQTREPAKWDTTSYTGSGSAAAKKAPSHGMSDHAGISLILDHLMEI